MWVKLNGVDSTTINGLMITSVPPITKPPKRTNEILIDGRDGDIIEDLGYAAYDKEFTILLHNNYDPNAVISFFSGSGTAVFSNESDKAYTYDSIEVMDIAKGTFNSIKVATVTLHCQPYKLAYPAQSQTISGTSATLNNTGNAVSAPRLTINGSGTVTIRLDNQQIFSIVVPSGGITIDAAEMNAYAGNNLANRSVTGSYENFRLTPGSHTLSRSGGSVSSMTIQNVSRWI